MTAFKPSQWLRWLPANDRAWWAPTSWPFSAQWKTPLMAASLPTFIFYPILASQKTWTDTFGKSSHGFQHIPRTTSITSSSFTRSPSDSLHCKFNEDPATITSSQTCQTHSCMPSFWPLHKVSPEHSPLPKTRVANSYLLLHYPPSPTFFPICPSLAQVKLEWDWTWSWERAGSVDMFTEQRDG